MRQGRYREEGEEERDDAAAAWAGLGGLEELRRSVIVAHVVEGVRLTDCARRLGVDGGRFRRVVGRREERRDVARARLKGGAERLDFTLLPGAKPPGSRGVIGVIGVIGGDAGVPIGELFGERAVPGGAWLREQRLEREIGIGAGSWGKIRGSHGGVAPCAKRSLAGDLKPLKRAAQPGRSPMG